MTRATSKSFPKRLGVCRAAFKERYPEIPWKQVAGSGNIYRHAYENVQEQRVWATIHEALPPLRAIVEAELHNYIVAELRNYCCDSATNKSHHNGHRKPVIQFTQLKRLFKFAASAQQVINPREFTPDH